MRRCVAFMLLVVTASVSAQTTAPVRRTIADDRRFSVIAKAPEPAVKSWIVLEPGVRRGRDAAPYWREAFEAVWTDAQFDAFTRAAESDDPGALAALARTRPDLLAPLPDSVRNAVTSARCDWGKDLHGDVPVLPDHLSSARALSEMLAAKVRLAVASGDRVAATEATVALGRLAEDLVETRIVVVHLVAEGVRFQWLRAVESLQELNDAPSFYFDLAPHLTPPAQHAKLYANERALLQFSTPELVQLRQGEALTREQWTTVLTWVGAIVEASGENLDAYELDPAKGPELFAEYEREADLLYRWAALPYPVALPRLADEYRAFLDRIERRREPRNPFVQLTVAAARCVRASARADRAVAALVTVEALRAHAATNGNRFPPALSDLKDIPAFDNPMTGRPFNYTLNPDGSATLSDETSDRHYPLHYNVRLRN